MSSHSKTTPPPVLIVGAGPSGLLASLWLTKYGIPHRIIDKATTTGQTSRAIGVQARTLEMYRMLGMNQANISLDQEIINIGAKVAKMNISNNGVKHGEILIGDAGIGQSMFPFLLNVTQDEHEEILQRRLEMLGQRVERGVEMVRMDWPAKDDPSGYVDVTIRPIGTNDEETVTASYVIGCDGAHSAVRRATGIAMEGGTYERSFFVADVLCHGSFKTVEHLNICLSRNDFVVVLPLPYKENRARLIGIAPGHLVESEGREITFDDCSSTIVKAAPGLIVDEVRWFAHYKVHHRCAASFQYDSRVFICGDAAHLHSPIGGQGMNTGLGDASNLAWKVATAWHVAARSESPSDSSAFADNLLATYSAERRRFADNLVSTNDKLFQFIIQQGTVGWLLRNIFMPYIIPFVANVLNLRTVMFGKISQTAIEYGPSTLSQSNTSKALQGHRLPWLERPLGAADEIDNHSLLDGNSWQAHAFGTIASAAQQILEGADIPIYRFPFNSEVSKKGFKENTIYLVRPDGYIGLVWTRGVDSEQDIKEYLMLGEYIQQWGVGPVVRK